MIRLQCRDKAHWLKERWGIGASDASCVLNENPYRTLTDLWMEKTGRQKPKDLSNNDNVQYGIHAEQHLREMVKLDFPAYSFYHRNHEILIDDEHSFLRASLDGEMDGPPGKGVLEIKTGTPRGRAGWALWKNQIPMQYYVQVLHAMMVTGYDYALVSAWLIHDEFELRWAENRRYWIPRNDEEILYLRKEEVTFWTEHVIPGVMPRQTIRIKE